MSPFGAKILTYFLLSTPLDGKGVPPFAIPVFYKLGKKTFLVYKKKVWTAVSQPEHTLNLIIDFSPYYQILKH